MNKRSLHDFSGKTDKSYAHQYIHVYEALFEPIRETTKLVLELGIFDGGSLLMWRDYFHNAQIFGMDINDHCPEVHNTERITPIFTDAYHSSGVDAISSYGKFDVIVDDGPHSLESQCFAVANYSHILSPNGILVVEDIPRPEWIPVIAQHVPEELLQYSYAVDRRIAPNRHSINDELMFIIDKRFI